ncbi:MAG TPA: sigma factor-like helix-turn-helix DNA-binding protein [Frankiaceae bacterium]|nr:sigma factor-like helix-turn-helix DNA-binding protein [Frankiaceae bacterium]
MSATGIGRFGGRERRLAAAQRAYGALPQAQRRVLVLRYVDDLAPDAVAARLGMPVAEVEDLLAAARSGLLRTPRPLLRPGAVARPVALAAVTAAFALTLVPGSPGAVRSPSFAAPAREGITNVVGGDAVAPRLPEAPVPGAAPAVRVIRTVRVVPAGEVVAEPVRPRRPRGRCLTVCVPKSPRTGDVVQVPLPEPVSEAVGRQEIELRQDHVPLCSTVPANAAGGVARCVPGSA